VSPLSIALYTYSTLPRGSVVHTANLADALHDAGCQVTVYALDKDGRGFFRPLRASLCLVPASPTPGTTAELVRTRALELAEHLTRLGASHDIHHAEDCLTASGLLQFRSGGRAIDLVRTVHHIEAFSDPFLDACQRRSILEARLCLTVSQATARDVTRKLGVHTMPITNGVDVDRFTRVDPRRLAKWTQALYATSGPAILAVGGVEERKNTLGILRAFARVRDAFPDARLWILGGASVLDHGAYRTAYEHELRALPAETRAAVTEIGVVDDADVPAIFRLASVLAFPSLHEGFGLAALEALAAGLPVVASHHPPLTEFLDESCAVLVDPASPADIARGIVAALGGAGDAALGGAGVTALGGAPGGPGMRREAGRRRALAHSWSRVALLHLDHYRRLLKSEGARDAPTQNEEIGHA
jgi:glycosyltransferase-like protein